MVNNGFRNYQIINALGNIYDLTQPQGTFLHSVQGHESATDGALSQAGNFYRYSNERPLQPVLSGTIEFVSLQAYDEFVSFCHKGDRKCKLQYKPYGNDWVTLDCIVNIEKASRGNGRWIIANVTFRGLSYWYIKRTYTGAEISLNLQGDSYFRLTIPTTTNPSYGVYLGGLATSYYGAINTTVASGQSLVIDTRPTAIEISKYNGNAFVQSAYQSSDFETMRMFAIPKGESVFKVSVASELEVFENVTI